MKHTKKQYHHAYNEFINLKLGTTAPKELRSIFKEFKKATNCLPMETLIFMGGTNIFLDWLKDKAGL